MHDVMRKRLARKLEALPDEQLYQVLDFIEFLESKYTEAGTAEPSGLQRFAERLEDRLRARSLAPRAMSGTMKLIGTAGRMLDTLAGAGQGIIAGAAATVGTSTQRRSDTPRRAERPLAAPPADTDRLATSAE